MKKTMINATKKTKKKYDRYSRVYNILEYPVEKLVFEKWRKKTFSKLQGKILEIGVGTGKNLKHYDETANVTGIDISDGMLEKAIVESKKLNKKFKLECMDAQKLQFKDNTFDYVVCTFVLCSIPNPVKALKEMRRVTKKNGKIIMIEHVLSKNKLIALGQYFHNPITKTLFGFNVNRNTKKNILKSGLEVTKDTKLGAKDIFRKFECLK